MIELDNEVAALRAAYEAMESMKPEAWARTLEWLTRRLAAERRDGMAAAYVIARFARAACRQRKVKLAA